MPVAMNDQLPAANLAVAETGVTIVEEGMSSLLPTHHHHHQHQTDDDLQVSFNNGLTIITGETGAGKSILLPYWRILCGKILGGFSVLRWF